MQFFGDFFCYGVRSDPIGIALIVKQLNLHEFAFEGQNMALNVNMLLTCIPHCAPGPTVIRTVCKDSREFRILSRISHLFLYDFLWRRRSFTARNLHVCLVKVLCFLQLPD